MHVPDAGRVSDLVLRHGGRLHEAHRQRELPQRAVVLRAAEELVVRVAHLLVHQPLPALRRHVLGVQKRPAPQLLRLQRLAVLRGGRLDRACVGWGAGWGVS